MLNYSVFNRWEKEEEPQRMPLLKKMFEFDMRHAKIERLLKNDESGIEAIKKKVWKHYEQLKDIFLFEIGRNGKATLGQNASTSYFSRTNVINVETLNLSTFDNAFISTNVNTHNLVNSAERTLHRYEFIELIVRLALLKFKD